MIEQKSKCTATGGRGTGFPVFLDHPTEMWTPEDKYVGRSGRGSLKSPLDESRQGRITNGPRRIHLAGPVPVPAGTEGPQPPGVVPQEQDPVRDRRSRSVPQVDRRSPSR